MQNNEGQIVKSKGEGVSLAASPAKMVKDGQRAADALMNVIRKNPKWAINIQGNEYLVYEAWQTVAQFFGCAVDTSTKPEFKQYGDAQGFEAVALVIDKKTGLKIGGATALCLNDEANWSGKPLFQLESMAQTRAGSKALRNQFSWVVVLAGYKATPAEEMMGVDTKKPFKPADTKPSPSAPPQQDEEISLKQLDYIQLMVGQGRVPKGDDSGDIDYSTMSKREASIVIENGIKTSFGKFTKDDRAAEEAEAVELADEYTHK